MTIEQERAIRQCFRAAGLPEYAVGELTACVPYLVTLLQQSTEEPFRDLTFRFKIGDDHYKLSLQEE